MPNQVERKRQNKRLKRELEAICKGGRCNPATCYVCGSVSAADAGFTISTPQTHHHLAADANAAATGSSASPSQLVEDTNGERKASSVQATGVEPQLQLSLVQGTASAVEAKTSSPQLQLTAEGYKGEGKFGSLGMSVPLPQVINKGDAQYPPPSPANTQEDVDAHFGVGPNAYFHERDVLSREGCALVTGMCPDDRDVP